MVGSLDDDYYRWLERSLLVPDSETNGDKREVPALRLESLMHVSASSGYQPVEPLIPSQCPLYFSHHRNVSVMLYHKAKGPISPSPHPDQSLSGHVVLALALALALEE